MNSYDLKALFYFPTTVLLVDDNSIFLSSLSLKLNRHIPLSLCDNPQMALELLQNTPNINDILQKAMEKLCFRNNSESTHSVFSTPLNLHEEIYNSNRFNYISTVVVDYSMPYMNGAELCRKIKPLHVKKIMLTAEADHSKAVELFNAGLIDYFIIKDSPHMHKELNEAIGVSQIAYFKQASYSLFNCLCHQQPALINDDIQSIHSHYFMQNQDKNFSEYYLLDNSGSMLLIDNEGMPTWLIVKSAAEIEAYYDIAINQDASEKIVNRLKKKYAIPFFFEDAHYKIAAQDWEPFLHDVVSFGNSNNFYCAVIENNSLYQFKEKIYSHGDFLKKL